MVRIIDYLDILDIKPEVEHNTGDVLCNVYNVLKVFFHVFYAFKAVPVLFARFKNCMKQYLV